MKIIRTIKNIKKNISKVDNLGFVPTMGGLHKGHLSLIKKSLRKCDKTIVSIYVNPTQFNNKKDFSKYPRNINNDIKLLKKINVDYIFIPKTKEIYKKKRSKKIKIHIKKKILCGKFRKGHFEGVVDIIDRFLNIIKPKYIFLGEKDFQQLFLIKKYVDKKFNTKIISCKTVRNKNFAALSSRNLLLTKKSMYMVEKIAKTLYKLKKMIKNNYNYKKKIIFYKNYLTTNYPIKIDYLELRNEKNLSFSYNRNNFRLFVAYNIDGIRLIDNF